MIRDLQKPVDYKKPNVSSAVTGETIKSIKGKVVGKGTTIGYWTKDTLRKEVAVFSNGEKAKKTTDSETTQTSTRGYIVFPSQTRKV